MMSSAFKRPKKKAFLATLCYHTNFLLNLRLEIGMHILRFAVRSTTQLFKQSRCESEKTTTKNFSTMLNEMEDNSERLK